MMEGVGEFPNAPNDVKIERFQEYVFFAMRGLGSCANILGAGHYAPELEATLRRHPSTWMAILTRKGIRAPLTNRIA